MAGIFVASLLLSPALSGEASWTYVEGLVLRAHPISGGLGGCSAPPCGHQMDRISGCR